MKCVPLNLSIVDDTTAPEFTFVPADYTVECSDEDADGRRRGVRQLR